MFKVSFCQNQRNTFTIVENKDLMNAVFKMSCSRICPTFAHLLPAVYHTCAGVSCYLSGVTAFLKCFFFKKQALNI